MKLSILVAAIALAACGGGGSSAALIPSAQAQSAPVVFYPAQPTSNPQPSLWVSHSELTSGIYVTGSSGYLWESVYTVTIPNLLPTDLVYCSAQAEVTNGLGYNVQIDRGIAVGDWSGSAWPAFIHPVTGTDIDPVIHHGLVQFGVFDETPRSGTVTYSLVLESASTAARSGDAIRVEPGYGMLQCNVTHGGA